MPLPVTKAELFYVMAKHVTARSTVLVIPTYFLYFQHF